MYPGSREKYVWNSDLWGISWCFYDNDNNNRTGARPIRSPDSLGMKGQFPLGKQPRPARVLVKSEADLGWRLEKGDGEYTPQPQDQTQQ